MKKYDVVIVGAGPAGVFAAMELVRKGRTNICLIEQVKRLHDTRNVSCGWMGGSARTDTTLYIDPGYGGEIKNKRVIDDFIARLDEYGDFKFRISSPKITKKLLKQANKLGIEVDEPSAILLSSDKMIKLENFTQKYLDDKIDIKANRRVNRLNRDGDGFEVTTNKEVFHGSKVFLGLGRSGGYWLAKHNSHLGLNYVSSSYDLGVRLEFPSANMREFTNKSSVFRLRFGDFRTTSPSTMGQVDMEDLDGVKVANSRRVYSKKTNSTSIGLLKKFYDEDPLNKVYNLTQIVNVLSDEQLLKEPLSRFMNGNSLMEPLKEYLELREGIKKMLELFPNIKRRCYIYSPEARLNAAKFKLSPFMESEIEGLYLIGDTSGHTRSFAQAACSGILAAQHVLL